MGDSLDPKSTKLQDGKTTQQNNLHPCPHAIKSPLPPSDNFIISDTYPNLPIPQ
ncbi:hypothetical protein BofuT4_uP009270.1 [Botrytis cinerea T4]|uniref:Uncharacterized protein n=1 Tax=Botryotinia fuckeliana (strain T4) TaxID=999810 RepID=G2XXD2_BOTF4|nr:hypothetical protein BofuT4_uP009270.1 [Botrytis cinerea T4]